MDAIIQAVEQLTFAELTKLIVVVQNEIHKKDPRIIAQRKQQEEWDAERERVDAIKEAYSEKVETYLRGVLKPGMKLKMKGCKDGKGIREFIKWDDNDNLVCWQIVLKRQYNQTGRREGGIFSITETKTNQVTTHMADKVQMIQYVAGGQLVPLSKLIG